jgi:putative ABC transport system substrate-binding protein
MDRRKFVVALVFVCGCGSNETPNKRAAATEVVPGAGQQPKRIRRIGVLTGGTAPKSPLPLATSLREFGWIEGENLAVESRGAQGSASRAASLAQELVQLQVEVLVTFGFVAGRAAKDATTTIPIVMTVGDPVRLGWIANLSHPGGNITGFSTVAPELAAKRLQILRELLPKASRIGELVDPNNEYWQFVRADYEATFRAMDMQPVFIEISNSIALEETLAELIRQRVDALIVRGDPVITSNRRQIMDFALEHGVPTMAENSDDLSASGFASYGHNPSAMFNQIASLVDKILRGAKPANLPFEQPTKLELVINGKTAKALGIIIPQTIAVRAEIR